MTCLQTPSFGLEPVQRFWSVSDDPTGTEIPPEPTARCPYDAPVEPLEGRYDNLTAVATSPRLLIRKCPGSVLSGVGHQGKASELSTALGIPAHSEPVSNPGASEDGPGAR